MMPASALPAVAGQTTATAAKANLTVVFFPGFETIDAMGPVEMLGNLADSMRFVSLDGGIVKSVQGVPVMTEKFVSEDPVRILLVPGAAPQVLPKEKAFFEAGKAAAQKAEYVLTVCTGSFLVAQTGLLKGRKATSNKKALPMVMKRVPDVNWQKKARRVADGKFYTSSGITAGMDRRSGLLLTGMEKTKLAVLRHLPSIAEARIRRTTRLRQVNGLRVQKNVIDCVAP